MTGLLSGVTFSGANIGNGSTVAMVSACGSYRAEVSTGAAHMPWTISNGRQCVSYGIGGAAALSRKLEQLGAEVTR